jgi:hypothetical protein
VSFFRSLQDSAFTDWFLGSESIWTYPTVLTLHTIGMAILVGASFVVHWRILQVANGIPLQRLRHCRGSLDGVSDIVIGRHRE